MSERLLVRLKSKAFLSQMLVLAAMVSMNGFGSDSWGDAGQGPETGLASPLGPEVAGCRVELRVNKKEYAPGEDIALSIILHNVSTNETGVSWRTDYGNYRFTIIDPTGRPVPLSANGLKRKSRAPYSIFGTTLPPGRPFKNGIFLNGHYEMTNSGSYTVTVSQEVKPKGGGVGPAWVPSAPLTITISGPKTNDPAVATPPTH
ncbi:MAG TPA: hypothetical protein P5233_13905 [Candidatus Paceibacterota bacterium]|mgnify:CR=1 FL=1|nr:hypothetical protein [Candidatus Paceibacterota bacterium]